MYQSNFARILVSTMTEVSHYFCFKQTLIFLSRFFCWIYYLLIDFLIFQIRVDSFFVWFLREYMCLKYETFFECLNLYIYCVEFFTIQVIVVWDIFITSWLLIPAQSLGASGLMRVKSCSYLNIHPKSCLFQNLLVIIIYTCMAFHVSLHYVVS